MKPELRLFLLDHFVVNPPPPQPKAVGPLVALFVPKLIELGLGAVASLLKKAGAEETVQASGAEFEMFYVADDEQRLVVNSQIKCILGVYGVFADDDEDPTPDEDKAVKALEAAKLVPKNADVAIVFEAAVVRTPDDSAFYLETRHFSVRDFIGARRKDERDFVATLTLSTPSATADGSTIAIGNITLGRVGRETLPIVAGQPLGAHPRYRSNLMPWNQIDGAAKAAYDSDVTRNVAAGKRYMPVTFTLTLSETADGNKFLAALGELLEGAKGEAAKELSALIVPEEREKTAKAKADSAEALYQAEEEAGITVKEAEAALAAGEVNDRPVLEARLAKARRALQNAQRLRKAAGLPDLG
jgi:hypothetical protein